MNCPVCDAELPEDARFCIECGATLDRASVGPTVQLRGAEAPTAICAACGARSPAMAIFCVRCGRRMGDPAPQPTASRPPAPPQSAPAPLAAGPRPQPAAGRRRDWDAASAAVFLIGLGLLLFTKAIWPGILIVVGLASFVRTAGRGRVVEGVRNTFWLFGLAFLFTMPRLFWPGVLVLFGISALLEALMHRWRRP